MRTSVLRLALRPIQRLTPSTSAARTTPCRSGSQKVRPSDIHLRVIRSQIDIRLSSPLIGTHVIWGVNFGNGTVQNAAAMAQSIANAFSAGGAAQSAGVILDAIQIGNEPDLYARHGNRSATYNIQSYLNECVTELILHFIRSC